MLRLSTSSPAPATSHSPPISPTITHVSSRSITPSLPGALEVDSVFHAPDLSRTSTLLLEGSIQHSGATSDDRPAEKVLTTNNDGIASHSQPPPLAPATLSAPFLALTGRMRILPLDISAYSDPQLPYTAWLQSKTTLSELAHLIRFQRLQEQKRTQARARLQRWLVSSALSSRLLRSGDLAYRTLVDCFRDDDREGFATLHSALQDVRSSCDAFRRFALLESDPENSAGKSHITPEIDKNRFLAFLDEMPESSKSELLLFVSEIRNNPEFLATRLAALTPQELSKLASFRPSVDVSDFSVMSFNKLQAKKSNGSPAVSPVERLLSFQRHDGLSALIFTVFANSSGPDSKEDILRTDAWATACAKLMIDAKTGHDRFIRSVLDAFAGMRGWPLKHKLEIFLMQALQAGQFLLEQPEDSTIRPSVTSEKPNKPLEYAADEYFELFVKRLFGLLDSEPSIGGLPEGAVEIGHAILKKLNASKKQRHLAEFNILYRWFFCSFLPQALMYPETHGIMAGFHISTFARERILRELATRMSQQALGTWSNLNVRQSISVMPEIKAHVDHLLDRLRKPRSMTRPMLVPARAVAAPKETLEVQPFIVLCPSDIKTLVYSLFPERHLGVTADRYDSRGGVLSSASSFSAVSVGHRGDSTPGVDGSSILSQSVSSITSDATTSREPLLKPSEQRASSESLNLDHYVSGDARPSVTDNYGQVLRMACSEMATIVGEESAIGSCHPFADRWAVLHLSQDGKKLLTRMRKDVGNDEMEENSLDSDSDREEDSHSSNLENVYHQLKSSVVKLLSEYELPKNLSDTKAFSHSKRFQSQRKEAGGTERSTIVIGETSTRASLETPTQDLPRERTPDLVIMLETALSQCKMREEFLEALTWHRTLGQLRKLDSPSLTRDGYGPLLHYFARESRESLSRCFHAIEEFDASFIWLKQSQERHDAQIEDMMLTYKDLRDKMWYKTEVLTSAVYDEAKTVAIALKLMSKHHKPDKKVTTNKKSFSKNPAASIFLKSETQTLDVMAAHSGSGGLNKLADEQVEMTIRWLTQNSVEASYCKGEERIHRLCMEVDKCVNRLVGDGSYDGPVLWSSKLYHRDRNILDSKQSDIWLVGSNSSASTENDRLRSAAPESKSCAIPYAALSADSKERSIPALLRRNTNLFSTQSSTLPFNLMDEPQDYFGAASPALMIDSSRTFWSPFRGNRISRHSRDEPSDLSLTSKTSTTKRKVTTIVNDDKRTFLLDLKQSLTGLLLSDLGLILFNKGSETDIWFSGPYAEECIKRKQIDDNTRTAEGDTDNHQTRSSGRPSGSSTPTSKTIDGNQQNDSTSSTHTPILSASPSGREKMPSNMTTRITPCHTKRLGSADFPYHIAYKMLLRRFSINPNPFSKLEALYELKLLIEQSLTSRASKSLSRKEKLSISSSPRLGTTPELSDRVSAVPTLRARNLEQAIAQVAQRRSQNIQNSSHACFQTRQTAAGREGTVLLSPDPVIDAMQNLFCDSAIRPRTLFRDLQYIAAFVPAQMLDRTVRGRAFWDASLAALALKQDVVRYMVKIADNIVQEDSHARGLGIQARQQQQQHVPETLTDAGALTPAGVVSSGPASTRFKMADAARMFLISAKEGDAAAERELAIFYLTQPDMLPRTILPLTKPSEVFRVGQSGRKRNDDDIRSDPATMCLAQHWMKQSRQGGDKLAADYLSQRDDMG